jgi:hypothetical protein
MDTNPAASPGPQWRQDYTDPTKLTTDAVNAAVEISRRELAAVRELLETRLSAMDRATELLAATVGRVPSETDKAVSALKDLLGARIDGMDTATRLLADQVNQVPTETDKRISALRAILVGEIKNVSDVSLEKFAAVDGTFASNALALTAALAAQEKAVAEQNKSNSLAIDKSERATKETIAANAAQASAGLQSQAATIADVKERVVRIETGGVAARAERVEQRADRGTRALDENQEFYRVSKSSATIGMLIAGLAGVAAIVAIIISLVHK